MTRLHSAPRRGFGGTVGEIDLRLLRVFMAVADHGGFAAAEVALGKNKSAISMDIANLEARLGSRLCQRGRGGFSLTDEGRRSTWPLCSSSTTSTSSATRSRRRRAR
jgi:LysR family transcriptional regulator, transcriptional activator for bauABCD operon